MSRIIIPIFERAKVWESDTIAAPAPEEPDRVPMHQRGVTMAFLHDLIADLVSLGRGSADAGQFLNGIQTVDSATDWQQFSRSKDPICGKSLMLATGTSLVETCITYGIIVSGDGRPYFGQIDTFVSYTWRGDGISLANMVDAISEENDADKRFYFVDVLVGAQHRTSRASGTNGNETDVGRFREIVGQCNKLLLYATPITKPLVVTRVWCLYELMSAMTLGVEVTVILSPADRINLIRVLREDFDAIVTAFTRIKADTADATMAKIESWCETGSSKHSGSVGLRRLTNSLEMGSEAGLRKQPLTWPTTLQIAMLPRPPSSTMVLGS